MTTQFRAAWPGVAPVPDTGAMGFNPHRQHRRSAVDIIIVAGALIATAAVTLWALLG